MIKLKSMFLSGTVGAFLLISPVHAKTTPGNPVATKVPLATLAELSAMNDLVISPDGTRAAVTLGGGNDFTYAIIDLVNGGKPQVVAAAQTFKDAGQRQVTGYSWANDRFLLITLASREIVFGQRHDMQRLVSFDVTTGKVTPVGWRDATADASDVLYVDKKNSRVLLSRMIDDGNTETRFLYRVDWVDIATGNVLENVQRPNPIVRGWAADGNGVVRMGFASDRDTGEERYLYRSGPNEQFKTVQRVIDKDFAGGGIRPEVFLDEPDMAVVSSNHEGYRAFYKANLKTMQIGERLFSAPAGYDAGRALANKDSNGVVGFSYATDRPQRTFTEARLKTIHTFLADEFGAGNARITSTNDDYSRLIIALARPHQQDSYYLYDTPSGSMKLIGYENASLKDGLMNPIEPFTYKASDGVAIEAIVTRPRLRAGQKKLPVVVLTHGGPYGVRDYAAYDQWAQSIAEQGYVVIQPNYRGSGGYGRQFVKEGRKDGFGTRMQDDLNDAVDALAARGDIDPARACMMGWSYGGYASARAAQRDPARWRCTIAGAGVYDLPMMRDSDQELLGSFGANYLAKGASSLVDVSPARHTDTQWSPILVVHGVRDPRVPIAQARTLVGHLKGSNKRLGVDYAYIEQPKNGHYGIYFTKEERIEWLGGASAWLDRFNPAYVQGDPDFAKKPAQDPATAQMAQRVFATK